jgi:hypothetical protein
MQPTAQGVGGSGRCPSPKGAKDWFSYTHWMDRSRTVRGAPFLRKVGDGNLNHKPGNQFFSICRQNGKRTASVVGKKCPSLRLWEGPDFSRAAKSPKMCPRLSA